LNESDRNPEIENLKKKIECLEKERDELKEKTEEFKKRVMELERKRISQQQLKHMLRLQFQELESYLRDYVITADISETTFERARSSFNELVSSYIEIDPDQASLLRPMMITEDFECSRDNAVEIRRRAGRIERQLRGEIDILIGDNLSNNVEELGKNMESMEKRLTDVEKAIQYYMKNLDRIIAKK
jgi:hypothetical protein